MNNESAAARMSSPVLCPNIVTTRRNSWAETPEADDAAPRDQIRLIRQDGL